MSEVIVVGSGASGVAAALGISELGLKPMMLDIGIAPDGWPQLSDNFYRYGKRHDRYDLMIGKQHEGLSNLVGESNMPVKLIAPQINWVTRDSDRFLPIDASDFSVVQSASKGGLANAWGAGLYRFNDEDLADFPITSDELQPAYQCLTKEIGITGIDDDLSPWFGSAEDLLPPTELSRNLSNVYRRYQRVRKKSAMHLGRARVAVLTQPRGDRPKLSYNSAEFFQEDRALYSPRYTLERLTNENALDYHDGILVERYVETDDGIEVHALDLKSDTRTVFRCRCLILAAGAINTPRIVLASNSDFSTELPLFDNPAVQIPFVIPWAIGRRLDTEAFGLAQLNLIWNSTQYERRLQGTMMEITGPSRAELFASLPLSIHSNLGLVRMLLPAMVVMQLFFPGDFQAPSKISLQKNMRLRIKGQNAQVETRQLGPLLRFMRRLGCFTAANLIVQVPTGHSIHYACTLPMRSAPRRYECHASGLLYDSEKVFIADSSSLSSLPAKNMSFTMMANAWRIANRAAENCL